MIRRELVKQPLSFLPFTLHQIGWNPDKHWGCERWRVALTLHHPSPTLHLQIAHGIETEARPVRSWAETTFLCPTDFTDLHRFSGWRAGEGWWRGSVALHPHKLLSYRHLCHSGEGWRVFLKVACYFLKEKNGNMLGTFGYFSYFCGRSSYGTDINNKK